MANRKTVAWPKPPAAPTACDTAARAGRWPRRRRRLGLWRGPRWARSPVESEFSQNATGGRDATLSRSVGDWRYLRLQSRPAQASRPAGGTKRAAGRDLRAAWRAGPMDRRPFRVVAYYM